MIKQMLFTAVTMPAWIALPPADHIGYALLLTGLLGLTIVVDNWRTA
ncbi:hypothetical protein [Lentzea tibetensis]|nr:hypothetical protein [Lentzea tibetensis]